MRHLTIGVTLMLGLASGQGTRVGPERSLCAQAMFSPQRSLLAHEYLADTTILELRPELAPIISDTTRLWGHPRRLLHVSDLPREIIDYAAWWPLAPDSVALFWRFGLGRGVFVAADVSKTGDLSGRLFLHAALRHEGPIPFNAKRVVCPASPV